LTLDESIQEEKDIVEDLGSLKIVFDKGIAHFMNGKSIDYQDGPQGGFAINDGSPGKNCGDCSC
jgi:Fe-S cluster assembly iron-binding protein IscA